MSIEKRPGTPNSGEADRVETQAIEWLAKLRSPKVSSEEHAEFAIWLSASPVHKQVFDELLELWDLSGAIQNRSTKIQRTSHRR